MTERPPSSAFFNIEPDLANIRQALGHMQRSHESAVTRFDEATRLGGALARAIQSGDYKAIMDAYRAYVTAEAGNFWPREAVSA